MKNSDFKEPGSCSKSETCVLEELILSLSMGCLNEISFTWEKNESVLLSVRVWFLSALIGAPSEIHKENRP